MIIGGRGGGVNNEAKGGFCDSQKSMKGDITYFCERIGRIFREDIYQLDTRKDSRAEPKKYLHDLRMYNFW